MAAIAKVTTRDMARAFVEPTGCDKTPNPMYVRLRMCNRKRTFVTNIDALTEADRQSRQYKTKFHVYKCPYCPGYHIAHTKGRE